MVNLYDVIGAYSGYYSIKLKRENVEVELMLLENSKE